MRRVAVLLLGGCLCAPIVQAESDAPPPGALPPGEAETSAPAEPSKPIERHFIADDDARLETLLKRLPEQEIVRLSLPDTDDTETADTPTDQTTAKNPEGQNNGDPTVPDAIDDLLGNTPPPNPLVPQMANGEADKAKKADEGAAPPTFPALWIPAEAPKAEGGLIILPGDGLHPDWPQQIHALRETLPRAAWSTLSLVLPIYQPQTLPVRQGPAVERFSYMPGDAGDESAQENSESEETSSDAAAPEMPPVGQGPLPTNSPMGDVAGTESGQADADDDSATSVDLAAQFARQQKRVDARLQSALDWLKSQQINWNTLVLQHEAAWWLLPRFNNGDWPKNEPIVLLDAMPPDGESAHALTQALVDAGRRPILDLYNPLIGKEKAAAEDRQEAYRRAGNDLAVQLPIYLPLTDRDARNAWVAKRVEGWLRQLKKDHPMITRGRLSSERQLKQQRSR